ncbi:multicopper oxidase family protein [Azospirillum halopraeferens]|uniref:multicopper oxidase family protein n=1 Tax=Azospirillum halopraeferens TaxID=34010 RepID=UPI000416EFEE|nr:multicopper oxidase family protein [Azospirillum halopraeferens]
MASPPHLRPTRPGRALAPAALLALALAAPTAALADTAERLLANPSEIPIERPTRPRMTTNAEGEAVVRMVPGGEALLDLNVVLSNPETTRIFNPSTNSYDKVSLRTYNGKLVAPTIRVQPGETVRINLNNRLKAETCVVPDGNINTPHCFNNTNLHAHGLWVSPTGNSDNVLLTVEPGVSFQHEYNIPADHPAGIYWYHPHVHGSTALQVAGGMGGALIVEGNRPPTASTPGDIDTILKYGRGEAFPERVLLIQQIQYACRDAEGNIKKKVVDGKTIAWICDPGDVGTIEGYDQFGPTSWQESNRFTTLNGEVQPVFADVRAGRIERWRMVHAGVRDTVNLAVVKARAGAAPISPGMGPAQTLWMQENCADPAAAINTPADPALVQWEVASDGQTHSRIIGLKTNVMQPGYRSDFLMVFPEPGLYCVVDRGANADSVVNNQAKSDRLLALVRVTGKPIKGDTGTVVLNALKAAAKRLPKEVRADVLRDLDDGMKTTRFAPHKPVSDAEVNGRSQTMTFSIGDPNGKTEFMVDGKPFSMDNVRTVILGTADEWTLSAANQFSSPPTSNAVISHPFHIHVNPFEIVSILNPKGEDVTDPRIPRDRRLAMENGDPQYLDLWGTWRDTVFVKQDYKVIMRTRYERYIGDFVLHCHILDHEDQGMMQIVRVALPASGGGVASAGHTGHATH